MAEKATTYVLDEPTTGLHLADVDQLPCTSPKIYKKLKPGKHVFRVRARDRAGNLDATPAVKRFKVKKRYDEAPGPAD